MVLNEYKRYLYNSIMGYENGKIYKITGSGMTYYGSTIQPLTKRLYEHIHKMNYSSKQIIELGNYNICLVELFSCKTKEELHMRERYYIENNECINNNVPTRTNKEYYKDNKEKIKENNLIYYQANYEIYKKYRDENKEKIKENNLKYRDENKEKIKEKAKQYYLKNKEKIKENSKKYYHKII
jgi:hypothetical protein